MPDPYNPHNTALFIEDLFSFFPSTFVQVFKLCSRISSSHQKSVIISSVYHALLVTSTVSYIFLFWLSNFHIRLHMAIKLKLRPFGLAWQLIVTTLQWSAVTTLRSVRFDTTTGFCVTANCGVTYLRRRLRLPDFRTVSTWRCQGSQPYASATFTHQEVFLVEPQ